MLEKLYDILTKEKLESILDTDVQIAEVNDKAHGFAYAFNNCKMIHCYEWDGNKVTCLFGPVPHKSQEKGYFYRTIVNNKFVNDDKDFIVAKVYNKLYPIFTIDDIVLEFLIGK